MILADMPVRILKACASAAFLKLHYRLLSDTVPCIVPYLLRQYTALVSFAAPPSRPLSDVQIRFFILDEADMMLSVGFEEDVDKILESVPQERQTLLFSATMPPWVKTLTRRHLNNPVMVDLVGEKNSGKLNEDIRSAFPASLLSLTMHCVY